MLQQTQVKTVIPYYKKFLWRFPTARRLAGAPEREVLKYWAGLGYYRRARHLHQAAQVVVRSRGGKFPGDLAGIRDLPGVGDYTAAAVGSIALGIPAAVVDGNVVRVLCRLMGWQGDPTRAPLKQRLAALAQEFLDPARPGDWNQAMMELGALLCTPRVPSCPQCPLRARCVARAKGWQAVLPELPERQVAVRVEKIVTVSLRAGRVWLVPKVPVNKGRGRMAGLWGFPEQEVRSGATAPRGARLLADFTHTIMHYRLHVRAYLTRSGRLFTPKGGQWVRIEDLREHPLPSADRKIAESLKKQHLEK